MKQHHKLPASRSTLAFTGRTAPFRRAWTITAACALALSIPPALAAQSPKPSPPVVQSSAAQNVAPPVAPQFPASLADQPPAAATITFRDGQLTINAHNSTLLQILQAITAQTKMKVQGSPGDHRIFGTYGPSKPDVVLSDLLAGFDFNFLVVGKASNGAPEQLILAGTANNTPEPPQPVQSIQPAPQITLPRPQFGNPRPYPRPRRFNPAHQPHRVLTPQEILKQLEAMHANQPQQNNQQ